MTLSQLGNNKTRNYMTISTAVQMAPYVSVRSPHLTPLSRRNLPLPVQSDNMEQEQIPQFNTEDVVKRLIKDPLDVPNVVVANNQNKYLRLYGKSMGRNTTMFFAVPQPNYGSVTGLGIYYRGNAEPIVTVNLVKRAALLGVYTLEGASGRVDANENMEQAVLREANEEFGFQAKKMASLGMVATSPGALTEIKSLYALASDDLSQSRLKPQLDEGEVGTVIKPLLLPLSQLQNVFRRAELLKTLQKEYGAPVVPAESLLAIINSLDPHVNPFTPPAKATMS